MGWNMSNILVNEAIANKKAGGGSDPELAERVTSLESEVETLETVIQGLNPLVVSSSPVKIGKWGNDDLYMQMVDGGLMTGTTLDIEYPLPAGATMRGLFGYGSTATAFIPLSFVNVSQLNYSIAIHYDTANHKIKITSGADESGTSIIAVAIYSVAVSNSRKKKS